MSSIYLAIRLKLNLFVDLRKALQQENKLNRFSKTLFIVRVTRLCHRRVPLRNNNFKQKIYDICYKRYLKCLKKNFKENEKRTCYYCIVVAVWLYYIDQMITTIARSLSFVWIQFLSHWLKRSIVFYRASIIKEPWYEYCMARHSSWSNKEDKDRLIC